MHRLTGAQAVVRHTPNRAERRIDVRREVVLVTSDDTPCDALILDVSSRGFRVRLQETLNQGEVVTLRIDRKEELRGQIRWVLGDEAGGLFLTPLKYLPS